MNADLMSSQHEAVVAESAGRQDKFEESRPKIRQPKTRIRCSFLPRHEEDYCQPQL